MQDTHDPAQPSLEDLKERVAALEQDLRLHKAIACHAFGSSAQAMLDLDAVFASRSWKLTAFYRWLGTLAGRPSPETALRQGRQPYMSSFSGAYYQALHEGDEAYQENNWLVPSLGTILAAKPGSVLEIGCGNGRFLAAAVGHVPRIIGVDWAESPLVGALAGKVEFHRASALEFDFPQVDVICSADVLEHFPLAELPGLVGRMHVAARFNYHVIACYDDGHSHISIMDPDQWLALFQRVDPGYRLHDLWPRRGDTRQLVCIVTNLPVEEV